MTLRRISHEPTAKSPSFWAWSKVASLALLAQVFAAVPPSLAQTATGRPEIQGRYELELEASFTVEESTGGLRLRGLLEVVAGTAESGFHLGELVCQTLERTHSPELDLLCQDLEGSYPWRLSDEGRLEAIALRSDHSMAGEALLTALAADLVLAPPPREPGPHRSWELDPVGEAEVEYHFEGPELVRRRLAYRQVFDQGALRPAKPGEVVVESETRYLLDRGRVQSLEYHQVLDRPGSEGSTLPSATSSTRLSLRRLGGEAALRSQRVSDRRWVAQGAPISDAARQRAIDRQRMAGNSYGSLVQDLDTLDPSPAGEDPDTARRLDRARLALVAHLRTDPQARQQALANCQAPPRVACRDQVVALGSAGTVDAQETLLQLYERLDPTDGSDSLEKARLRHEIARALGTRLVGVPTPATIGWLIEHLDDPTIGRQAAFGLGAHAGREERADRPEVRQRCLEPLVEHLERAESTDDRVVWVRALGNTASPGVRKWLEPLLDDPDPVVAQAAARVLTKMERGVPGA